LFRFHQLAHHQHRDGRAVGISDDEVADLVTAFRLYGFWRIDLDSGLLFGSRDMYVIFDIPCRDGAISLVEFRDRLHADDLPMLMQSFEHASTVKSMFHSIYRVRAKTSDYKYVRSVGRFREKEGTSGEIIGVTYELFQQLRTVAFCEA
jgi:PAS fold